jgi:hypothetical protein
VWATRDVLGYLADAADALLGGPNPARSAFEALDRALTDGAGVAEAVAGLDALPAPLRAALADRG